MTLENRIALVTGASRGIGAATARPDGYTIDLGFIGPLPELLLPVFDFATLPFLLERQKRLEGCLSGVELRVQWKGLSVLADEAERMHAEEEKRGAWTERTSA